MGHSMTNLSYRKLNQVMAIAELEIRKSEKEFNFQEHLLSQPGYFVQPNSSSLSHERYLEIRESIWKCLNTVRKKDGQLESAEFDKTLLSNWNEIFYDLRPYDAAHPGTWSYLTLRVLYDVALVRFPNHSSERYLGKSRNVFWRLYQRHNLLGPELSGQLLEDEAVQIMERTALLGSSKQVARAIASAIVRNRSQVKKKTDLSLAVRESIKLLRREFSTIAFYAMQENDLASLVDEQLSKSISLLESQNI